MEESVELAIYSDNNPLGFVLSRMFEKAYERRGQGGVLTIESTDVPSGAGNGVEGPECRLGVGVRKGVQGAVERGEIVVVSASALTCAACASVRAGLNVE